MRFHTLFLFTVAFLFTIGFAWADTVLVSIILHDDASYEVPHTWGRELAKTDAPSVQIRRQQPGDVVTITQSGTPASPIWRVTGSMDAFGTITMPDGAQFRCGDAAGLATWIRELPGKMKAVQQLEDMPNGNDFGLSAESMKQLLDDLKQPVGLETAGLTPVEIVQKCSARFSVPLHLSARQIQELSDLDPIDEELSTLSKGTVLAYALRPAGLVFIPREVGGKLQYCVEPGQKNVKPWPIGSKVSQRESEVLPDLIKIIPVDFNAVPLRTALESISSRLEVPFLYDLNSMARFGIDLDTATVSIPGKKMSYQVLLKKVLSMHKLKCELRMDENGEPFYWITTYRTM